MSLCTSSGSATNPSAASAPALLESPSKHGEAPLAVVRGVRSSYLCQLLAVRFHALLRR